MYLLLKSDPTESWDESIDETHVTDMSTAQESPETQLMAYYGSEDRFLLEHLNFLVLHTQPRAVVSLYNARKW